VERLLQPSAENWTTFLGTATVTRQVPPCSSSHRRSR
jgi:hypothetical protein